MIMKAKFVDPERLLNNLDTAVRDAEIKAFWKGISKADMSYENKLLEVVHQFIVSYETAKKVVSETKK